MRHGLRAGLSRIREDRVRQLQKEAAERASLQAQGRCTLQDLHEARALVTSLTSFV